MLSKIRAPWVAGKFYEAQPAALRKEIECLIDKNAEKEDCLACMLPHAGYMYSGGIAAKTLSKINIKDKVILLGPNHTGMGKPYSIMTEGIWQTPLGEIAVDTDLASRIIKGSKYLVEDPLAHLEEHSLEVELPFLQYFKQDFKIVPIAFMSDDLQALKEIGREIAQAVKECGLEESTLLVASSDMTHFETEADAHKKDNAAIEAVLKLDEDLLFERVKKLDISMCGYMPAIVMLSASKFLGAKKTKLVGYQTSGDVTGDRSSVVGYAGVTIYG